MIYKILFFLFDLTASVVLRTTRNPVIRGGSFRGMRYLTSSVGSSLVPKILGTYEIELTQQIAQLPQFDWVLDVGAAEGYYAVGLLHRNACRQVIAWEMTAEGRALMKSLAKVNGVADRLEIRGRCDPQELSEAVAAAPGAILLVIDCEGYEGDLLEPLPPELAARCSFLIETHNPMNPGVHERLATLLRRTHEVTEISPRRRTKEDLPIHLPGLLGLLKLPVLRRLAMAERRATGLGWLLCRPKAEASPAT